MQMFIALALLSIACWIIVAVVERWFSEWRSRRDS